MFTYSAWSSVEDMLLLLIVQEIFGDVAGCLQG